MWQGRVDHYALLQQGIGARTSSAASPRGKAEYLHTEKQVPANCLAFSLRGHPGTRQLAEDANAHTGAGS